MGYNPAAFTVAMTNMMNDMACFLDTVDEETITAAIERIPDIADQLVSVQNEDTATDVVLTEMHEVFGNNQEVMTAIAGRLDGFWAAYKEANGEEA